MPTRRRDIRPEGHVGRFMEGSDDVLAGGRRPDGEADVSHGGRSADDLIAEALHERGGPGPDPDVWPPEAEARLAAHLHGALAEAERRGWRSADLDSYVLRMLSARHLRLLRGGRGLRGGSRTTCISGALDLLRLLRSLPRLPSLSALAAAPGADAGVDVRVLGRVRALLAKAESTEFPEEAEALSARAQQLMARHSIDRALLSARTGTGDAPSGRRVAVDNPYDGPKAALLTVVADANRCRAVWHRELGLATVLGFPADLAAVEVLFTSLLVQATAAMLHAGPRRDALGRSRTRSFRHAFLNAYAARVGERLRESAGAAVAEAGGKDLLPVLSRRDEAVRQAVDSLFPNLSKGRARTVSNHEGWAAGRAAADRASLDGLAAVAGPSRVPPGG
ncbi:DUF2786 domain-containing protein [Actinomadura parmotrematis]|uniref:DUF2786 domain-containing protein n=1 Tax=Actinomadura parmotrematis TaxID=2864039 RepID=A0ABS7G0A6_9ACTN|nr:DUF2786 domain-containing protein [Actinomadura parmotrematis]MBW8486139.1 DUF2786 domain-containing protein [Actinomadura parmotrematis]